MSSRCLRGFAIAALLAVGPAFAQDQVSPVERFCGGGQENGPARAAADLDRVLEHIPQVPVEVSRRFEAAQRRAMDSITASAPGTPTRAGAILRDAGRHPLNPAWQLRVAIAEVRAALNDISAPSGPITYPSHADAEQALRAHRAHARVAMYQSQLDSYLTHPSTRKRPNRERESLQLAASDPGPMLLDFADCKLARVVAMQRR